MTESNAPTADIRSAQDRIIAATRALTFAPIIPGTAIRTTPSRGPRRQARKIIR